VYNNSYKLENNPSYLYSWGVGIESAIYAENNFFKVDDTITPDRLISALKGTAIFDSGTLINDRCEGGETDIVQAFNALNDPDLTEDVGWAPTLFTELQSTKRVPTTVRNGAGPIGCDGSDGDHGR
jgi:pectate lyase